MSHLRRSAFTLALAGLVIVAPPILSQRPDPVPILIHGVTLVDGVDSVARGGMTILVNNRRITAVGPDGTVPIPRGARRIDGRGRVAIPGLWDMHVHLASREELHFLLANGITSVRDMGSEISVVKPWRDSISRGLLVGPRIKTSGPVLESPRSIAVMHEIRVKRGEMDPEPWRLSVSDPKDAQAAVDSVIALGADFIKARTYANVDTYFAIAAAARRRNVIFAGHPPFGLPIAPDVVADSGQRTFEHGFFPDRVDTLSRASVKRVGDAYLRNGTTLVPTNVAWEGRRIAIDSVSRLRPSQACGHMPPAVLAEVTKRWAGFTFDRRARPETSENLAEWNAVLTRHYRDLATLHAEGVRILPGTDIPAFICPDIALNREIEILVQGVGLSPLEALRSATRYPAELFGLEDVLGTIEVGKYADIVLLDANPLTNIRNLRRIQGVIANGVYYARPELLKR